MTAFTNIIYYRFLYLHVPLIQRSSLKMQERSAPSLA